MKEKNAVSTGLDVLVAEGCSRLRGKRVAVLANQSAVDRSLRHLVDLLYETKSHSLKAIFAPEHGFRGELQDMATVANVKDKRTGLPVHSLYGSTEASLTPTQEQLEDLDVLVVDLPDIGSRYYTFAQSLGYAMQACQKAKVQVVVLDRPNPISGSRVEGSHLRKACRSFCGYAPVPIRHGLTLGELAILMNKGFGKGEDSISGFACNLEVLGVSGWKRNMYFDQTGLLWVTPSPNMPTLDTAIVYPGGCLLEATNISEGRGTTRPFEIFGAPFLHSEAVISEAKNCGVPLEGVILRPLVFQPKFHKFADQACNGIQVHVTDREGFQPFRCYLALIWAMKKVHPKEFAWRKDAYEFVKSVPAIDLLYGDSSFRELIDNTANLATLLPAISAYERAFVAERQSVLLY